MCTWNKVKNTAGEYRWLSVQDVRKHCAPVGVVPIDIMLKCCDQYADERDEDALKTEEEVGTIMCEESNPGVAL